MGAMLSKVDIVLVCVSVCAKTENCWSEFDEIWCTAPRSD